MSRFRIEEKFGDTVIEIDGMDVSKNVLSYQFRHDGPTELPRLLLEVRAIEGVLEGEAVVQVESANDNALEKICSRIASLNPAKLEEKALERLEWGDGGSMTSALVQLIQEQLLGTEPQGSTAGVPQASAG